MDCNISGPVVIDEPVINQRFPFGVIPASSHRVGIDCSGNPVFSNARPPLVASASLLQVFCLDLVYYNNIYTNLYEFQQPGWRGLLCMGIGLWPERLLRRP